MNDASSNENLPPADGEELGQNRRVFLQGMGKWSTAAIAAAVAGSWLGSGPEARAGAWINRRGGWLNRGGAWVNRVGGGGSWVNRGGGGWVNRRGGGGSWINRR